MGDPDPVEVDEQVEERPLLIVCLEEGPAPVNLVELHKPLSGGDVDEAGLKKQGER